MLSKLPQVMSVQLKLRSANLPNKDSTQKITLSNLVFLDYKNISHLKGIILTDPKTKPEACSSFVAEIIAPEDQPLNICICQSYEPVIVTHSIRQSCSLQFDALSSEEIKNNEFENKENLHRTIINAVKSTFTLEGKRKIFWSH